MKNKIGAILLIASLALTDEEFTSLEHGLAGLRVYGHRGLGGF